MDPNSNNQNLGGMPQGNVGVNVPTTNPVAPVDQQVNPEPVQNPMSMEQQNPNDLTQMPAESQATAVAEPSQANLPEDQAAYSAPVAENQVSNVSNQLGGEEPSTSEAQVQIPSDASNAVVNQQQSFTGDNQGTDMSGGNTVPPVTA